MLGMTVAIATANSLPIRAPKKREAKNRPPRKPEPREMVEARTFSPISRASAPIPSLAGRSILRAPWPAANTCGLIRASPATKRPPTAGRNARGRRVSSNPFSTHDTMRMISTPRAAQSTPRAIITR